MGPAGLTEKDIEHLKAKGLTTVRFLAKAAVNETTFEARIMQPYITGTTINGAAHKTDRDADLATASFLVALEVAQLLRAKDISTVVTPSAGLGGGAPPASSQQGHSKGVLDKVDWQHGVDRWKNQWNPPQIFPAKEVTGAEQVLYR